MSVAKTSMYSVLKYCDYHRITKIKPRQPISETVEYVTWDYVERLVLDSKPEPKLYAENHTRPSVLMVICCSMADDCAALGFEMDCGHAFSEKYGKATNDFEALERVIGHQCR